MLCLGSFVVMVWLAQASPEPPRMLFQGTSLVDPGAGSGARVRYAIMRMPDGSFAFHDRYHPQAGPLVLPDGEGRKYTLLPPLPRELVASEAIIDSKVLANAQVILTPSNEVVSVYVQGEKLDRETAARVGLPRYLDV